MLNEYHKRYTPGFYYNLRSRRHSHSYTYSRIHSLHSLTLYLHFPPWKYDAFWSPELRCTCVTTHCNSQNEIYILFYNALFSHLSLSDGDQFSPTLLFFKLIFRNELGEHGRGGKEFNVDFLSLITSHARTLVPYTRTYNGEACQQNPNAVYLCHCAN